MSIFKITNSDVEPFSLETNPKAYFTAGSSGVSGVQYVFSRKSTSIKNELEPTTGSYYDDGSNEFSIQKQTGNKVQRYFDGVSKKSSKKKTCIVIQFLV